MDPTPIKTRRPKLARNGQAPIRSAIPGIVWPAPPNPFDAMVLALQYQFEESETWTPQRLLDYQFRQLRGLITHAHGTVPFYRQRLAAVVKRHAHGLDMDAWRSIPLLSRRDIQKAGERLISRSIPKDHGRPHAIRTSGSTGQPIQVMGTGITTTIFKAMNLRNYLWHRVDFSAKVAAIRRVKPGFAAPPDGVREYGWAAAYETGPAVILNVTASLDQQLDWLQRESPPYLLSYPSNLAALAHRAEEQGLTMPWLQAVHTIAEVLDPAVREECQRVWGTPVIDMYSANEIGVIALQCPQHAHYHVVAEGVLVEVLDESGRPCPPGKVGRVVLTPLHNVATPLIRYDIGDYAEPGPPCPCGRGLPVLKRILGRARNMILLPSGERRFPALRSGDFSRVAPVRQFQLVQRRPDRMEIKLVVARPLSQEEEDRLRRIIHEDLRHPFELHFRYVDEIPRAASGKFEDCLSELTS